MKILIVDDSLVMRNKIQRSIAQAGVEVVGHAANGQQAIDMFVLHKPNLVTMDITMPEMDGLECVESILRISPAAKILVISALADKATALEALKRGASGFLCKPFNDQELAEALEELLG